MFRGNVVMRGYLKNKATTEKAFAGGWFHSGDLERLLDRKSTRLNSSHTEIYTLSLHDALPIYVSRQCGDAGLSQEQGHDRKGVRGRLVPLRRSRTPFRSEEHTSELQSHRDLHSFPTRRSSDLCFAAMW